MERGCWLGELGSEGKQMDLGGEAMQKVIVAGDGRVTGKKGGCACVPFIASNYLSFLKKS